MVDHVTKVEITFEGGLVRTLRGDAARAWQEATDGACGLAAVHGCGFPAFGWEERRNGDPSSVGAAGGDPSEPLWLVRTELSTLHHRHVHAPDAMTAARRVSIGDAAPDTYEEITVLRQIGEPWVRIPAGDWYGLGDAKGRAVLVFERALGHLFTVDDVLLLFTRVAARGFSPVEFWNGAGCSTLSIACASSYPSTLSPADIAVLTAARPEGKS